MGQKFINFAGMTPGEIPDNFSKIFDTIDQEWIIVEDLVDSISENSVEHLSGNALTRYRGLQEDTITAIDTEVLVRVRGTILSFNSRIGAFIRGSGIYPQISGITVEMFPWSINVERWVDGERSQLASFSTPIDSNVWYWLRVRGTGQRIQVKFWTDVEPVDWSIDVTDQFVTAFAGNPGLLAVGVDGARQYDVMGIGWDGQTAPTTGATIAPMLIRIVSEGLTTEAPNTVDAGIRRQLAFPALIRKVYPMNIAVDALNVKRQFPANFDIGRIIRNQFPMFIGLDLPNAKRYTPFTAKASIEPFRPQMKIRNSKGTEMILPLGISMTDIPFTENLPSERLVERHGAVKTGTKTVNPRTFGIGGSIFYPIATGKNRLKIRDTFNRLMQILSHPPIDVFQKKEDDFYISGFPVQVNQNWMDGRIELVVDIQFNALNPFTLKDDVSIIKNVGNETDFNIFAVTNVDRIPTRIKITPVDGTIESFILRNISTNQVIDFSGHIGNFQTLDIDTGRYTADIDGVKVLDNFGEDWFLKSFEFQPWHNRLSWRAVGFFSNVELEFIYTPKYY